MGAFLRTETIKGIIMTMAYNVDTHKCEQIKDEKDAEYRFFDYFVKYDNADTLVQWYNCYNDLSWMKYEEEE